MPQDKASNDPLVTPSEVVDIGAINNILEQIKLKTESMNIITVARLSDELKQFMPLILQRKDVEHRIHRFIHGGDKV